MHHEVVTIGCVFHPTFPFAQDYSAVRLLQKPQILLCSSIMPETPLFLSLFPMDSVFIILRQHCKQHAVQWSLGSCSCGSFWLSGETVKTNSKNELQRESSCLEFFIWKRQARSQIFVKRQRVPNWPQTCFPTIPTSLLLRNVLVIRPSHTWTHRIQARSTYKTPSAFSASVL